MTTAPRIGLVGSQGSYGRWLRRFFEQRMGLRVFGRDPGCDSVAASLRDAMIAIERDGIGRVVDAAGIEGAA
ncbi:hypothetical protein [Dyella psychrodurans]|uniref:Prephenate dehydrogenase/arogenate dehydrogenase family protein n=1 Tax=Dyella psychrodurans TaxID=1927960 RepID=A0A370XAG2_9GAMM|nr:hypothetical protein [Dyella psychrodurans]RDS85389.1 hypothetical protein DWU99_07670 [Dyella psychrodurans]